MKFLRLISAYLIALSNCMVAAQSIGVADFHVEPDNGTPPFKAKVWYPTSGSAEQLIGVSRVRPGYFAVPDGDIALAEPAPLIVLNHGSGGSADSMAWLATALVRKGAIVVGADHPASSGGDPERASMLQIWTQPEDVQVLLDEILRSDWGPYIDEQKMAAIGFSLGGASAMSLAGARYHFESFPLFCATHDDGACAAFDHLFPTLNDTFYARANGDFYEPRLKVTVAIAPGFSESITAESLQNLQTPVLLISGENDQQLPPTTHIYPIMHLLPQHSSYIEIIGAQHFSFLPECGLGALDVLAETNEEFVCQEMGNKSRIEIHKETIAAIEHFLRTNDVLPSKRNSTP